MIRFNDDNTAMTIDGFDLTDRDVVLHFAALPDDSRDEEMLNAISLGIACIQKVRATGETEFVRRRVTEMTAEFNRRIDEMQSSVQGHIDTSFDPEQAGSVSARLRAITDATKADMAKIFDLADDTSSLAKFTKYIGDVEKHIEALFDPAREGSYVSQIQKQFTDQFADGGQIEQKIRSMLSLESEHSPLRIFMTEVRTLITEIKTEVASIRAADAKEEELQERISLAKGMEFEEVCEAALSKIAAARGDEVESTGATATTDHGSKKGDFIYIFPEDNIRVAIEAKKRVMGVKATWDEIEAGRANRNSAVGVIVFAEPNLMHASLGGWAVRENRLIATTFDMLEPTLRIARLLGMRAADAVDSIDAGVITAALERVAQSIKNFTVAKRNLTAIDTSVGVVRQTLTDHVGIVNDAIEGIEREIAKAKRGEVPVG